MDLILIVSKSSNQQCIVALTSLLGMYFVRSAVLLNVVAYAYVMICLLFIVVLLSDVLGGHEAFIKYVTSQRELIRFDTPPLCGCCKFLPTMTPTSRNIRYIQWLTIQSPYVRIVLEIILFIAFSEQKGFATVSLILNLLKVISMLLALYGCNILLPLGKEKTKSFRIVAIFRFVNLTQICLTLQMLVFEAIGSFGAFGGTLLSSHGIAMFWNSALVTWEMCAMSVLATVYLHPRRCALFDKYHRYSPRINAIADLSAFDARGRPSVTVM